MDHINGTIIQISKDMGDTESPPNGSMTILNAKNGRQDVVTGSIVNWMTKGQYVSLDGEWRETRYNTEEFRATAFSKTDITAPLEYKLSFYFKEKLGIQMSDAIRFSRHFLRKHTGVHPVDQLFYAVRGNGVAEVLNETNIQLSIESKNKLTEYLIDYGESLVRSLGPSTVINECIQINLGGCQLESDRSVMSALIHLKATPAFKPVYDDLVSRLSVSTDPTESSDMDMGLFDTAYQIAYDMTDSIKKNSYNLSLLGIFSFWDAEAIGRTFGQPYESTARYFSAVGQAIYDRLDTSGGTVMTRVQALNSLKAVLPAEDANKILKESLDALDAYSVKNQERGFDNLESALNKWIHSSLANRMGDTADMFDDKFDSPVDKEVKQKEPLIPLFIPVKYESTPQYYTHKSYYYSESMLAGYLDHINRHADPLFKGTEEELIARIDMGEKAFDKELDEDQRKALIGLCTSTKGVHTMTAGPGCGKTMMMEFVSYILSGKAINFVTPTGKAAKVLDSKVKELGYHATTIHKFASTEDTPKIDLMVVDETSMLDMHALNAGLGKLTSGEGNPHVIFLGDTDQLPSVGTGKILADLMDSPAYDHHRLTKTFRNSGGILEYIKGVRDGCSLKPEGDSISFIEDVEIGPHMAIENSSKVFYETMNKVLDSVKEVGAENTLVLLPYREPTKDPRNPRYGSHWDAQTCNHFLQEKINPDGEEIRDSRLRIGDRFLNRKNITLTQVAYVDYADNADPVGELYVPNGETGTIVGVKRTKLKNGRVDCVILKTDEGVYAAIPAPSIGSEAAKNFKNVQLGYAMTVHSSQGSQAHTVFAVFPGDPAKKRFAGMNKQLLYTAVSRAQSRLFVVGNPNVLNVIAKQPADPRTTTLTYRIAEFEAAHPVPTSDGDDDDRAPADKPSAPSGRLKM